MDLSIGLISSCKVAPTVQCSQYALKQQDCHWPSFIPPHSGVIRNGTLQNWFTTTVIIPFEHSTFLEKSYQWNDIEFHFLSSLHWPDGMARKMFVFQLPFSLSHEFYNKKVGSGIASFLGGKIWQFSDWPCKSFLWGNAKLLSRLALAVSGRILMVATGKKFYIHKATFSMSTHF